MTSAQHAAWIRRGSPWRLARPLLALRDRLRGYGYTVYDIGNASHLDAQPPEHHCPYSEVNWPAYVGKPMPDVVTADDIMPPPAGSGLPSLQALGAQIFADKQAGLAEAAWIVDMNWGPGDNNHAVRDTWRPSHSRSSSSDTGHIHLSCRSDAIDSPAGDTYDPVARLRGQQEGYSMSDSGLIANAERGVTALYTGADPVVMPAPWNDEAATGFANPLVRLERKVDDLTKAVAKLSTPTVDVQALAALLAPALNVDQAALVAALQSPEGQAALTAAANRAEDS